MKKQIRMLCLCVLLIIMCIAVAEENTWTCSYDGTFNWTSFCAECGRNKYGYNLGDIVAFGAYEQDNYAGNGKEPIEWIVLDVQEDKVILLSALALDCVPYDTSHTAVTWETCTLRKWLNDTFINEAFSGEEKAALVSTKVSAFKEPIFPEQNVGKATWDYAWILSPTEANDYLGYGGGKCIPTVYSKAKGAATSSREMEYGQATCWYWARSSQHVDFAYAVYDDGYVGTGRGLRASESEYCVRPVICVNLNMQSSSLEKVNNSVFRTDIVKNRYEYESIVFGSYEQDNNKSNGTEPIEWLVLEKQGNKALLLSKYALDFQPYGKVKNWLKEDFLNNAFSMKEREAIQITHIIVDGTDTQYMVFLLSTEEADKYLITYSGVNMHSRTSATAYAKTQDGYQSYDGCYTTEGKQACLWWLRDRIGGNRIVVLVDGSVSQISATSKNAVRPALWIDLNTAGLQ